MKLYELTDTLEFKHLVIENIDSCISMYFSYLNVDDILKLYADNDIRFNLKTDNKYESFDGDTMIIVPLSSISRDTSHISTIGFNSDIQYETATSFLDMYTKLITILRDKYDYDIANPFGLDHSLYIDSMIEMIKISKRDFEDHILDTCVLPIGKIELFEDSF